LQALWGDFTKHHDTSDGLSSDKIKSVFQRIAKWRNPKLVMLVVTGDFLECFREEEESLPPIEYGPPTP